LATSFVVVVVVVVEEEEIVVVVCHERLLDEFMTAQFLNHITIFFA